MANRSFKPASSFLAAQPTKRSPRPSFARTSSNSSNKSANSDDSFIKTLRNLAASDKGSNSQSLIVGAGSFNSSAGAPSPRGATPPGSSSTSTSTSSLHERPADTPSRKRSQPIAIELPPRNPGDVYTPLTARGDLPGGYFPNHEATQMPYKSHPFSKHHAAHQDRVRHQTSIPSQLATQANMSNFSSTSASPTYLAPKQPQSIIASGFNPSISTTAPDLLTMPMGKYHPSNFRVVSPAHHEKPSISAPPMPPASLSIPIATGSARGKSKANPGHERQPSDVKRKIQEYQKSMMVQAKMASTGQIKVVPSKPDSPRLIPLGSPGPITPFELENEQAGYLIGGSRVEAESLMGNGRESGRHRQIIEDMIRAEKDKRALRGNDGSRSPALSV